MLLPAPKFSAGPPTLGHHEFLSPSPARCPDRPSHIVPALQACGFLHGGHFSSSPHRFIASSLPIYPQAGIASSIFPYSIFIDRLDTS